MRVRETPWWLEVAVVFIGSRLITTAMMLALARVQGPNAWTGANPDYASFANMWDGRWYNIIAVAGYPSDLPTDDAGDVTENAWAFMPAYPVLVRLVMVTGLGWNVSAVLVTTACALGASLVFHRLMTATIGARYALFATVLFCAAPLSPILQVGYAEAMMLLLVATALLLLVQHRYAAVIPVVGVMAFTRPGALAFALTLALHVVYRWVRDPAESFPIAQRVLAASVALLTAGLGMAWPAIAWAVTGVPGAYAQTELTWREPYIHDAPFFPLAPWFQSADWWLGQPLGTLAVLALVVAFALILLSPAAWRLGVDLRFWAFAYGLYLVAVFFPQSSTFRLLMPLFPLLGIFALPKSVVYRVLLVVFAIAAQGGWLLLAWGVDGADWTPP